MHLNFTDEFFTKEISDLNSGSVVRDSAIDGKVSIDSSHLVFIAPHYTSNGILNDRANCSHGSEFLSFAEMLFNL